MSWFVSILVGVLSAMFGAVYGGLMANAAVKWLRITSFEGASGYFVVAMALVALLAGLALGIAIGRFAGGPGIAGFAKALGWSLLVLGGGISLLGGLAWSKAERPPLVEGKPIDLAVELSLPADLEARVRDQSAAPHLILFAGGTARQGDLGLQGRREDGRWILGGRLPIHNTGYGRMIGAVLQVEREQYFDLPLPDRPALSAQWSDWLKTPSYGDRSPPPIERAYALRYRVEHRPAAGAVTK